MHSPGALTLSAHITEQPHRSVTICNVHNSIYTSQSHTCVKSSAHVTRTQANVMHVTSPALQMADDG